MVGIVILIIAAVIGISVGIYSKVQKSNMMASGDIIERSTKDLTKKAEIFTTKIKDLQEIYEVLKNTDLVNQKINMEYSAGMIRFTKNRMITSLTKQGEGRYRLCVDKYIVTRTNGIKTGTNNTLEMNLIFTAVEKAILRLDYYAEVEEEFVKRV